MIAVERKRKFEMTNRQRFQALMNFQPFDRLPVMEWAAWWDKTIERWKKEGLPEDLGREEINDYFGMDRYVQVWISPYRKTYQEISSGLAHGEGLVKDIKDYQKIREHLYPQNPFDRELLSRLQEEQKRGETVLWITLEGFFWFPRKLFGIERHLYAFYDQPELMKLMNQDLLEFHLRVFKEISKICIPDFLTFAEDLSYNHGPMISRKLFEEFLAPYYLKLVPFIKEKGTIPFVDSDGNIEEVIPWFLDVGIDGFLPLERQAGIDVVKLRRKYPRIRLIGGYDKRVLMQDENAMKKEFEYLLPVAKEGGYIISVDHQTPPEVSFANYKTYLRLFNMIARSL